MPSFEVLVPSRGRPESAQRLNEAFKRCSEASVVFIVDDDDPRLTEYVASVRTMVVSRGIPGIVDPLNRAAQVVLTDPEVKYVGFMGDDHLPRTAGWDVRVVAELDQLGTGIVYGNDLLQGENLPTAAFMSADIVRLLGFMAPPVLRHLWVDNYWKELGQGIDRLRYLGDLVIEHLHPLGGKAEWDQTYEECNNPNSGPDRAAFELYKASGRLQEDIECVRSLF